MMSHKCARVCVCVCTGKCDKHVETKHSKNTKESRQKAMRNKSDEIEKCWVTREEEEEEDVYKTDADQE